MTQLNEDQALIVDTARAFAQERLRPNARRWEEEGLDRGVLRELAGLGFAGIYVRHYADIPVTFDGCFSCHSI